MLPCPICRPLSTTPDIATSDRDPSACRPPALDLQSTATAAAAPAPSLRSSWRHVTHVWSPKIRHIECNEPARNLLPGAWSGFLSDRSLAKDRAGTAGSRLPTERGQDKSRTLRPGRTREKRGNISTLARCAFLTRDVRFLSNQAKSTLIRTLRAEDTSKDSPSRSGARGTAPRPLGAPQRSFRCRPRNRQTG